MWPRLAAQVAVIVVDLSDVDFLGVPGLHLLHQAHLRTQARSLSLRLVTCDHATLHILQVTGLAAKLACHPTVEAALTDTEENPA